MSAILLMTVVLAAANVEAFLETCNRKVDLALVVDSSTSICGSTTECDDFRTVRQFCKNIVNSLTVGKNDARVAFVSIRDHTDVEWNFAKYTDKPSLKTAIDNVVYSGGELQDPISMVNIIAGVFNPLPLIGTDRIGVQNIAILVTNGAPKFEDEWYAFQSLIVRLLRSVYVFVVCVTPGCTEHCAQGIASPPKQLNETYFLTPEYAYINEFGDRLVQKICVVKTFPNI